MGCRQAFPDRQLDTNIPFITKNLTLPFKHVPAAYVGLCFVLSFLFEVPIDWSLIVGLWTTWVLMRLFIRTKSSL